MKKKLAKKVLAEGEVTGHAHRVDVDVYEEEDCRSFSGPTPLTHEEHKPLDIPEGEWESGVVQEYDPFMEESRKVRD